MQNESALADGSKLPLNARPTMIVINFINYFSTACPACIPTHVLGRNNSTVHVIIIINQYYSDNEECK